MRNFSIPHPLAHAYIVTGGDEEERLAALRQLAAAYLCEGGQAPCGRCRHCVKVERDIHPDVTTLSPAGGKREILVDQARAMRADVYIRPNEGERKVYLIHPADMLKTESQNVLLKVLEEGPPYAAFLLAAAQPGRLLDTIRSRCETITLPPREERPDPELLEQGDGLARLLTEGDEFALACEAVRLEQIIKGRPAAGAAGGHRGGPVPAAARPSPPGGKGPAGGEDLPGKRSVQPRSGTCFRVVIRRGIRAVTITS